MDTCTAIVRGLFLGLILLGVLVTCGITKPLAEEQVPYLTPVLAQDGTVDFYHYPDEPKPVICLTGDSDMLAKCIFVATDEMGYPVWATAAVTLPPKASESDMQL